MCWAICFAMGSTTFGQIFGPSDNQPPSELYGEPTTDSVYTPQGPQSAFYTGDPGMQLPQANGIQQPGELQSLNYSQSLGEYGNLQLYGSPTGQGGMGANYQAVPSTWGHVRDLQMGVYTNEDQTVFNGGSTLEFYVNDRWGIAGRVLGGGTNNINQKDEYHFTGDIYGGTTILKNHWFKFGWLWDVQDNFHKTGPAWGALLWADHKHPISLDIAYGIGYGDPVIDRANRTLLAVADDDLQLRAGTYITPNLQTGFSGNWLNWADGQFEDYNAYGGFVAWNYGDLAVNVDITHGNELTRGFVNVAYTFGGRRPRPRDCNGEPLVVEHPRDWITKPVMRNVGLQLQRVDNAMLPPLPQMVELGVGNITQVSCAVRLRSGTNDLNGNGVIDPGDTPELVVQLVNASGQVAQNVSFGSNAIATPTSIATTAGTQATIVGNVAAGDTFRTQGLTDDINVAISSTATPGSQVFVDFDVIADGQRQRFRCGPIIVGQSPDGNFSVATPSSVGTLNTTIVTVPSTTNIPTTQTTPMITVVPTTPTTPTTTTTTRTTRRTTITTRTRRILIFF